MTLGNQLAPPLNLKPPDPSPFISAQEAEIEASIDLRWMRHAEQLSQNQGDPQEHLAVILRCMADVTARNWLTTALKENQLPVLRGDSARQAALDALAPYGAERGVQRTYVEELGRKLRHSKSGDQIVAAINKLPRIEDPALADELVGVILKFEIPNLRPILACSPSATLLSRIIHSIHNQYLHPSEKHEFAAERAIDALSCFPNRRARDVLTQIAENRLALPPEKRNTFAGAWLMGGFWGGFAVGVMTNNVILYFGVWGAALLLDFVQGTLFLAKNAVAIETIPDELRTLAQSALEKRTMLLKHLHDV